MLTRAAIWYGNGEVRLESDGACALEIYYNGSPSLQTDLQHRQGSRKILIWNDHNNLFMDGVLFAYGGELRILRVEAIDWDLNTVNATINIENVHYWELIESDWDYIGQWSNLNLTYSSSSPTLEGGGMYIIDDDEE